MKYDFSNPHHGGEALMELTRLISDKKKAEIKVIKPRRSLNQNSYLHLLLGAFGAHFGYTLEESKTIYKDLNSSIYYYDKEVRGKVHHFSRSSADLDKDEMTKSIDVLREWSKKAGYPLPTATDQEWLMQIENEIERHEKYL